MSSHIFRDENRAIDVIAGCLGGDMDKATRILRALVAAGIELPHPVRDWVRQHMPNGSSGFVVEDLDWPIHAVRIFGPSNGTDETGLLRFGEFRHGSPGILGESKTRTLGLIDLLCRRGDGTQGRYWGITTLNFETRATDGRLVRLWLNGEEASGRQFRAWLSFDENWRDAE